ncbi:MAG: DNA translocase FtsK [Planctomycetes bacterium]|nr:DNA translocase FtsK [Planctomycetota bacterium]
MFAERNRTHDLVALVTAAVTMFIALALVGYSAADAPSHLVYPTASEVQNICGRAGAWTAFALLEALGLGAFYLAASLAALAYVMFRGQGISDRAMRAAGWVLSLVGLTALLAMAVPSWSPGPAIGSGGYLGAMVASMLRAHVASAGAYLLAISLVIGGWLLCTDYLMLHVLAWTSHKTVGFTSQALERLAKRRADHAHARPAVGPSIRIGGKVLDAITIDEELELKPATVAEVDEVEEVDADATDENEAVDDEADAEQPAEIEQPAAAVAAQAPPVPIKKRGKSVKDERQEVMNALDQAANADDEPADYQLPPIDLLLPNESFSYEEQEKEVRRKAKILEKTFASFGFNVKVVEIETGPVIAQFEVELESGLRLAKITGLADDLAIALRVPSVRIVAPIPGKNTVGVEVPNEDRQLVRMREVIEEAQGKAGKMKIPIYLGKDVAGNPMVADLASLPHLLIAGRTGTGKSVCLNTLIMSMLMTRRPDELRMLLIDPKMVELSSYKTLPHLMHPVVTDMKKAEALLAWAVEKMEERYALLARAGVRHISAYNQLGEEELFERLQPETDEEQKAIPTHLPYIVIVADEMADLMMTSAKEVETHIIRLAQKSRAVGIHLVLATQKPTVDVITGLIKSNLPARICFQVASRTDSRVVLDEMGADKLLGNGDMLFLWPGTSTLIRGQGTYLSDDEINKVIEFVGTTEPEFVKELVQLKSKDAAGSGPERFKQRDELYEAAIDVVVREGRGSVSLLQRALGVGYGRAARLVDFMAEDGIVGDYNGSQAREVLITLEQWAEMSGQGAAAAEPPPSAAKRSNRIKPEHDEFGEGDESDVDAETDDADAFDEDAESSDDVEEVSDELDASEDTDDEASDDDELAESA